MKATIKQFSILSLILIQFNIYSQSSVYKPFCNNPSWTTGYTSFGGTTYETYQYQLDTVIGIHTYKKIQKTSSPFDFSLFREDVAQKKVYQYDVTNSIDYLYFDFNLSIGNTFTVIANGGANTTTVTTKDSMLINGCYHNTISLNTISPPNFVGFIFTEGILSQINPINPFFWGGDPYVHVVCECHSGQSYYYDNGGSINNFSCYLTCTPAATCSIVNSINELKKKNTIDVYPNPNTGMAIINLKDAGITSMTLKVYDVYGRVVFEDKVTDVSDKNYELNVDIKSGIYFVEVIDINTEIYYKQKLVIQK